MSRIEDITLENLEDYGQLLKPSMAENIGREYYNCIAAFDPLGDEVGAAMVWELKNTENPDETRAEIVYFGASEPAEGEELLREYGVRITDNWVKESFFELDGLSGEEKELLSEAGFQMEERESRDIMMTLAELNKLSFVNKKISKYIISIGKLDFLQFRQGLTNCLFCGKNGLEEDLALLPADWYENNVSCCVVTDGKVNGLFLVHKMADGILMPVLLFAMGMEANRSMLDMICYSIRAASAIYPEDTLVLIRRHDEKTRALTAKLFPNRKGVTVTAGERKEE